MPWLDLGMKGTPDGISWCMDLSEQERIRREGNGPPEQQRVEPWTGWRHFDGIKLSAWYANHCIHFRDVGLQSEELAKAIEHDIAITVCSGYPCRAILQALKRCRKYTNECNIASRMLQQWADAPGYPQRVQQYWEAPSWQPLP